MNKKVVALIVLIITITFITIIISLNGLSPRKKENKNVESKSTIKAEIKVNLTKIMENSDLTSSNPYTYTNNKYYDNTLNIGSPAVAILEEMYNNNELVGVQSYLSALAIQEITNCNLQTKYNLEWTTAEEFYKLWKDHNCGFKK